MSKANRSRRKRANARKAKIESRKQSEQIERSKTLATITAAWRGISFVWKIVLGILAVLALLSEIYFNAWRMSVTPGEARNASDPFSTMFVLYNEGQFAMYDITFSCQAHDVVYESSIQLRSNVALESVGFNAALLEANARTSTPCWTLSGDAFGRVVRIDASLFVSYRPSFSPFRRTAEYRFVAQPNEKGGYAWTPMGN